MHFLISSEQHDFQLAVDRYLREQLSLQRLNELVDKPNELDSALWAGLANLGGLGLLVPEEYGGLGLELIDAALVAEIIGRHAAPMPYIEHCLAILSLQWAGSADQKARWLPGLANGSQVGTVAFRGLDGWRPTQWTIAGERSLSGEALFVPYANAADLIVVGTSGGHLSVVEKRMSDIEWSSQDGVDRTRPLYRAHLVEVSAEHLDESQVEVSERLLDAGLALLAADAFGGGMRCLQMSVDYAKTREQFGVVIGQFQGLKHQLANMALQIEPTRALFWYAAHAQDHLRDVAPRIASLAKAHLTDRFLQIARDAVEAHGGIGYTWDYPLQVFFKRAMFDSAWLGTSREQRIRVATLSGW